LLDCPSETVTPSTPDDGSIPQKMSAWQVPVFESHDVLSDLTPSWG
jgi:hypothetical protein